jgi:predicted ATPase
LPYFINTIEAYNFKSFEKLAIKFNRLNILVGANASGKSNFITLFKFLKDISLFGLEDALVIHGGIESIQNMRLTGEKAKEVCIKIGLISTKEDSSRVPVQVSIDEKMTFITVTPLEITYQFKLSVTRKTHYHISYERADFKVKFLEMDLRREKKKGFEPGIIGEGNLSFTFDEAGKFQYEPLLISCSGKKLSLDKSDIFMFLARRDQNEIIMKGRKDLAFCHNIFQFDQRVRDIRFYSNLTAVISSTLSNIGIFDIDPRLSKKSILTSGKAELESDGSNLPTVLYSILRQRKNVDKMATLLNDILPFIEKVSVDKLSDRSFLTCLKEKGYRYGLPAPFISDGTINIIALLTVLYFHKKSITLLEEPERNIHPKLLIRILDMMKDVSTRMDKQLIITTHNPTVVKSAGIDNLLLISRKDGFSEITRPSTSEKVKSFLAEEIGIDELFIKNLLG